MHGSRSRTRQANGGITGTMKHYILILILFLNSGIFINFSKRPDHEIREYQGKKLDPFERSYDNSIKGPQNVDIKKYRLEVSGMVKEPQSLSYGQIMKLPSIKRVIDLHCVEGWSETLLFEGVRLADILKLAMPLDEVKTVIFYAVDGYSSSISYNDVRRLDILLATKINGRVLDATRGFPLQVLVESKYGYKWVKWVTKIVLSKDPYKGFWEQRGYDNEANYK
jgi:DMSO/TMAO reductase YedYZ molybdopterin-dependent catalytic subunit